MPIWCILASPVLCRDALRADASAGNRMPMSSAMIDMTTNSSMSVKACLEIDGRSRDNFMCVSFSLDKAFCLAPGNLQSELQNSFQSKHIEYF
jgi:hypothetical protein